MPRKKAVKNIKLDDLEKPLTEQEMKETTGGTTLGVQFVPPPPTLNTIIPPGAPQGVTLSPQAPVKPLPDVIVKNGAVIVTNHGGSPGFQAGQFGYVPNASQPPVIVPSNPNVKFTPPPSFNASPKTP